MSRQSELAELSRVYDSSALSNRNILINGSGQVYQRGSGTIVTSGTVFGVDRFKFSTANMDNIAGTFTQDSDSPDGFGNSMKATITTAESVIAADEYAYIAQLVEAQNLQQLSYGTSAAKQLTLSFWVKSSITGTFAVGLYKPDNTAQIHNLTYTINSASTWEYKTLTFAANTLSGGAVNNDNGVGFYVNWHLAAGGDYKGGGSTSGWSSYANNKWADGQATDAVITTTSATFQLTGCQLEVGDSATPFEHRTFSDELTRCQRYYNRSYPYGTATAAADNNTPIHHMSRGGSYNIIGQFFHPRDMRAAPTVVLYNPNNGTVNQLKGDGSSFANAAVLKNTAKGACMFVNATSITETVFLSVHATFDAEL